MAVRNTADMTAVCVKMRRTQSKLLWALCLLTVAALLTCRYAEPTWWMLGMISGGLTMAWQHWTTRAIKLAKLEALAEVGRKIDSHTNSAGVRTTIAWPED